MNNINILVVEDDADINNLLCGIIQRNGYSTRSAFSGSEAEMYLKLYDYQLVLLDLMLPAVTGEELIEKIRRVRIMPIIVISAKSAPETKIIRNYLERKLNYETNKIICIQASGYIFGAYILFGRASLFNIIKTGLRFFDTIHGYEKG